MATKNSINGSGEAGGTGGDESSDGRPVARRPSCWMLDVIKGKATPANLARPLDLA